MNHELECGFKHNRGWNSQYVVVVDGMMMIVTHYDDFSTYSGFGYDGH